MRIMVKFYGKKRKVKVQESRELAGIRSTGLRSHFDGYSNLRIGTKKQARATYALTRHVEELLLSLVANLIGETNLILVNDETPLFYFARTVLKEPMLPLLVPHYFPVLRCSS